MYYSARAHRLVSTGSPPPSFVSTRLENEDGLSAEEINDIKFAANSASMYGGEKRRSHVLYPSGEAGTTIRLFYSYVP